VAIQELNAVRGRAQKHITPMTPISGVQLVSFADVKEASAVESILRDKTNPSRTDMPLLKARKLLEGKDIGEEMKRQSEITEYDIEFDEDFPE
jgi:hypothetical protein